MTYRDAALFLGIKQVCFDLNCGLSANRHETGVLDPFSVIHWRERRINRAGLRRFLLLAAKRARLNDPEYLNEPQFHWLYLYRDNVEAGRLAANLGIRLPAALSRNDRLRCLTSARKYGIALSAGWPQIYKWARKAVI